MKRVIFELSMPNRGSWNGKWSGEGRSYNIIHNMTEKKCKELEIPTSWYYRWDDGWGASVSARVLEKGERAPKSDGFCGYDWMVKNIINYGSIYGKEGDTV